MSLNIRKTDAKVTYSVLSILREHGKPIRRKELLQLVEERIGPTLTDTEREIIGKSTFYPRWRASMDGPIIWFSKAGFLVKENGEWRITPEGIEALESMEMDLLQVALEGYRKWDRERTF